MRKIFLTAFLALPVFTCTNSMFAQSQIEVLVPHIPLVGSATPGSVLNVVTTAQPTLRKRCVLVSVDGQQLVCKNRLHETKTYLMSEVIAIIQPARKDPTGFIALPVLAGCGALIYAAIVVSSAIATAGLSVAALVAFGVFGAMEVGDNFTSYDELLYQKPGTTLAAALHLKL